MTSLRRALGAATRMLLKRGTASRATVVACKPAPAAAPAARAERDRRAARPGRRLLFLESDCLEAAEIQRCVVGVLGDRRGGAPPVRIAQVVIGTSRRVELRIVEGQRPRVIRDPVGEKI